MATGAPDMDKPLFPTGTSSMEFVPGQRLVWNWTNVGRMPVTIDFGPYGKCSFWLRREDPFALTCGTIPGTITFHDPAKLPADWPNTPE